ncbi:ataxin-10 [Trichonephila inaurata madagascariensis]|uniref:Ataxin-10 n=1 Tax=Trichonephila inaurata madagascariensis TaxID=2747483 RepID=A0A8X6IGW9_9ARAC|nr:ataxin-10 [Trichonephila inaurata madagascariensis]
MVNTADEHISQLIGLLNISKTSYDAVTASLQKMTALMQSFDTRCDLSNDHWKPIEAVAKECRQFLTKNEISEGELSLLIELLRFLRNSCGGLNENLNYVLGHDDLLSLAKESIRYFIEKESPKEITALKIVVQLFGNILVSSEHSKPLVWDLFFRENKFRHLFQHGDVTIRECAMMVLFNSMSDENSECIFSSKEGHEIIFFVTDTLLFNQIDWGLLFIEQLLNRADFFDCCYNTLPIKHRLLILDIMEEKLKSTQEDQSFSIPGALVSSIKNQFLKNITHICEIKESDIEPCETVSMLSILCTASICDAYISLLQNSKDLLQTTVEVLKCIHLLGKEGCNVFSSLSDLKYLNNEAREEIASHPLNGFKKNLIRLIGNVCCGCKDNQDLVRKLDGIPLILDCCKFDAKNPYITQWGILAIRNLLENNLENQAVIANISASGEISDPKLLNEMGIQIHSENGKIRMKSLPFAS